MSGHARLKQDVLDALRSFELLIADDEPAASSQLVQERVRLVQAVNAYIAHLGRHMGPAGPRETSDSRLRPWREAHDALLDLRLRYSQHISRWSGSAIGQGWKDYQAGSRLLVAQMREHFRRVEALPPLAGY